MSQKDSQLELAKFVTQGFALVAERINELQQQQNQNTVQTEKLNQRVGQLEAQVSTVSQQLSTMCKALPVPQKAELAYKLKDSFPNQTEQGKCMGLSQGRVSQLIDLHKKRIGEN